MRACLVLLLAAGCATTSPRECHLLRGADHVYGEDLVNLVDHDSALQRLLESGELPSGEFEVALAAWFEEEWSTLTTGLPDDASLYWFKESKGALGYRQGVIAVRRCRVLRSSVMVEDN